MFRDGFEVGAVGMTRGHQEVKEVKEGESGKAHMIAALVDTI